MPFTYTLTKRAPPPESVATVCRPCTPCTTPPSSSGPLAAIPGGDPSWTVALKFVVQAYAQSLWQLGDRKHCSRISKILAPFAVAVAQQLLGVAQSPSTLNGGAPSLKVAAAKPLLLP